MVASMRLLALLLVGIAMTWTAHAAGELYIFDVIKRPNYRTSYSAMLRGSHDLPSWMATPEGVERATTSAGVVTNINGTDRELFSFCEPHNCAGHTFVVMFDRFGDHAVGALSIEGHPPRFFGSPDPTERKALTAEFH